MSYVVGSLEDGAPFRWTGPINQIPPHWRIQVTPSGQTMVGPVVYQGATAFPIIEPEPGYVPPGGWKTTPAPATTQPPDDRGLTIPGTGSGTSTPPATGGAAGAQGATGGEAGAQPWVVPAVLGGLLVLWLKR